VNSIIEDYVTLLGTKSKQLSLGVLSDLIKSKKEECEIKQEISLNKTRKIARPCIPWSSVSSCRRRRSIGGNMHSDGEDLTAVECVGGYRVDERHDSWYKVRRGIAKVPGRAQTWRQNVSMWYCDKMMVERLQEPVSPQTY